MHNNSTLVVLIFTRDITCTHKGSIIETIKKVQEWDILNKDFLV